MIAAEDQKDGSEAGACREAGFGAFEDVVREHQRMVHSLCFRMTGSVEDAEDLAQETFLRAFRQLSSFRGEAKPKDSLRVLVKESVYTWDGTNWSELLKLGQGVPGSRTAPSQHRCCPAS